MYATLIVRKDDSYETLCFLSKADAQRFRRFVRTYIDESGAGNGYGAYWIVDDEIDQRRVPPAGSKAALDHDRLKTMLFSILRARTAKNPPDVEVALKAWTVGRAVAFTFGMLPPRQRPGVGDMFRVIRGSRPSDEEAKVGEGRVVADRGKTFEVVSCWDDENGKIKPGAKRVTVRASKVMKIDDWNKAR